MGGYFMKKVFETGLIGTVELKNRILRSATHEGMGDLYGKPLKELYDVYEKLAKGGAGAIITGYVGIKQSGKTVFNMRMFDKDEYVPDYKALNLNLKHYNTPVILQLAHGGSQTSSKITGDVPISASPTKNYFGERCKEASESEIEDLIGCFVKSIERAKEAEFTGVQLHAAHGYLLSEFLSPFLNKRRDGWGGNVENRFRILREILQRSREKVGRFPIWVKVSAFDENRNRKELEELIEGCQSLQENGCDAIEVSCGYGFKGFDTIRVPKIPVEAMLALLPNFKNYSRFKKRLFKIVVPLLIKKYKPIHNYNVKSAERIKKNVNIPVIVVGGIRRLEDIENIIENTEIDFVSMCRPFIIEPNIVNKFQERQSVESKCIDCGYCLLGVASKKLKCYFGKIDGR
jgi:2,4-dienoyl-CoA reductase-like NADH-dependent reductase (Old Yellow Enzyme family)